MTKEEVILKLKDIGLLAVVRVETIERGYEIAQGCLDGGRWSIRNQLYK